MKKISSKPIDTVIQIEITNKCNRSCSNCVRLCGHFTEERIFFANLESVASYLNAFRDFTGWVGYIGGEPTLHPEFRELCYLMKQYRPKNRAALFTNTLTDVYRDNREMVEGVFGMLNKNDHSKKIMHTPVLVASEEIVSDPIERYKYFDDCWIQNTWSATITPKGAYFCEVCAMLAWLYDGPDGWDPRDPNWWKKDVSEYKDQIDWGCNKCGAALPLYPRSSGETVDDVSIGNITRLIQAESPKIESFKYGIYDRGLLPGQDRSRDWYRKAAV